MDTDKNVDSDGFSLGSDSDADDPPAAAVGEEEPRARAGVRSEETRLPEDGARRAVHRGTADDADGIDATAHMFVPPS